MSHGPKTEHVKYKFDCKKCGHIFYPVFKYGERPVIKKCHMCLSKKVERDMDYVVQPAKVPDDLDESY